MYPVGSIQYKKKRKEKKKKDREQQTNTNKATTTGRRSEERSGEMRLEEMRRERQERRRGMGKRRKELKLKRTGSEHPGAMSSVVVGRTTGTSEREQRETKRKIAKRVNEETAHG